MLEVENKTVLITGASSGIGREFAKAAAEKNCHLILVARRAEKLHALAGELKVPCEVISADLSVEEECKRVLEITKAQGVEVLINCAGFGLLGTSTELDTEKELQMIDLNVRALHLLTKTFLDRRKEEGTGAILNVASCAGLLPAGPYMSTYYATKAYVASYTQGLARELRDAKSDIYVGALCPGPVETEFSQVAFGGTWDTGMTAEQCVAYAMKKMKRRKVLIVPGFSVRAGVFFSRFASRSFVAKLVGKFQKKRMK